MNIEPDSAELPMPMPPAAKGFHQVRSPSGF
jgi:hypothetical protein